MSNKNIKNELAYFNKVIKNMEIKENIKTAKIKKHEFTSDAAYGKTFDNFDFDKYIEEQSLLGWIEFIEDKKLYKVVKKLSIEDQKFLSYIVNDCITQKELALMYNTSQVNISYKFRKVLRIIKNNLHKK